MKLPADISLKLIFDNGLTCDLGQIESRGNFYNKTLSIPISLFIRTRIFHLLKMENRNRMNAKHFAILAISNIYPQQYNV